MKVILHPEARSEFFEAVEFYANESTSLAERFIKEFEVASNEIGLHPDRYRKVRRASQIKEFRSFPYSLVYRVLDDMIKIDAIAHDKRKPGYWKKRV
jgi:toxin ParE1/3/4